MASDPLSELSRVGLSVAPGKRTKGRDGKVYERSLQKDLEQLQDNHRVALIVCLLNESELRSLGVQLADYKKRAAALGMTFLHIPVVEMAPFEEPRTVLEACEAIDEMLAGNSIDRALIHCRGGVGRAGTFAACYCMHRAQDSRNCPELVKKGERYAPQDAIAYVRQRRCQRALECRKQEDFVTTFAQYVELRRPREHSSDAPTRQNSPGSQAHGPLELVAAE
jgi:protein-tyrosine phosphatase